MNKKSVYSAVIFLIFVRNIEKRKSGFCDSINQVVKYADKQMKLLEIPNDLSHSTKYSIVKELIDSGFLFTKGRQTGRGHKVYLSKQIRDYIVKATKDIVG